MNSTVLTDALRGMDSNLNWKFAMFTTYKARDGVELEWHLCNMQDISGHISTVRDFLLKKPVSDKDVAEYSPFLSYKENIFALESKNEMVHAGLTDIFMGLRNAGAHTPPDFVSGRLPKISGYAFCAGENESDANKRVLYMYCKNPLLSGASLYVGAENEVVENTMPIFKFANAVDLLFIGGVCYLFSASAENVLSFENRHIAIAEPCIKKIADAGVIGNFDSFEMTAMKIKNAKKFMTFNDEILDYITRLPIMERVEYLEKYGVELDKDGKMNSYETIQSELIIDLLCGRSCLDPLNRLSVGSIVPRD